MLVPPQLLAIAWQDTEHTNMLSSMHHLTETEVLRRSRQGRQPRSVPHCPADYNDYMGAVDQADSLRAPNTCQIKSVKWRHLLFFCTMDVSMMNA